MSRWTRRAAHRLLPGDIISPEYNWAAPILAVRPCGLTSDWVLIICDPYPVMDLYDLPLSVQFIQEVIGPHKMKRTARPLFWDGPNNLETATVAARF